MRICCIANCASRTNDIDNSFFEIHDGRKEWLNIIRKYQTLDESHQLFICDLHFTQNDVNKYNTKCVLKKNAVPTLNLQTSDDEENTLTECSKNETEMEMEMEFLEYFDLDVQNEQNDPVQLETDTQLISINTEQYKNLMQLVPEVERLKHVIHKMECIIKSKDAEIKQQQKTHQHKLKTNINLFKLSTEQRDVIKCLINGISGAQYSENLRKFCLRQLYYSPAAYQSLRLFFNKHLPSKRTLQLWYSSIDGSPGISESALEIIREKAASYLTESGHPLHICVMFDDMAIRKKIGFNIDSQKFDGFVTAFNASQTDTVENVSKRKVAKEVAVTMAVGPDFKIPIAYDFIDGLESIDRARITVEIIRRIEATGAIVMSLTGDGNKVNIATVDLLGAKCNEHQPYFQSPTHPEQMIYFIFDPPHLIKLVRKHFSMEKLYHKDELIDWNLLRLLESRQSAENFSLCKLSRRHIDWYQQPMNVKVAAETISKTNAILLRQLKEDGFAEFQHSDTTAEFILNFNDSFDIQNFDVKTEPNDMYKQPVCVESAETIFGFAERFKQYVEELEIEKKTKRMPILRSRDHTGFLGFYNNFISLEGIYKDFVLNGPLEKFYCFQFSQDHLESLFSLIRNCQGRNDNPSTIEFRSAFRKLLVCHPIITSRGSNVITNATGILTVSSRKPTVTHPLAGSQPVQQQEYDIETDYSTLLEDELNDMDPYDHHIVAYAALCVEEKLIQKMNNGKHKYKCSDCINLLRSPVGNIRDEFLALKSTNSQPKESTANIVIYANAVMKIISEQCSQGNDYNSVLKAIYNNLNIDDLYIEEDFTQHQHGLVQPMGHKDEFIIHLIKMYMTFKSQQIGHKITEEERGILIRNRKKKDVHNAGQ